MKLTRRQEEFVQKMLELKQEFDGPVRYSLLAERLGVSPFTAYDMLCLLEEKGYVTSGYQLPIEKSGPGRAERLFYPSELALNHEQRMIGELGLQGLEDERLFTRALEQLSQRGILPDDLELMEQLSARLLPAGPGDLRYCVEVMTVAALRLKHTPGQQALVDQLAFILPAEGDACRVDLGLLGGFVFGLLAQQSAPGQEWLAQLREHLQGYLRVVLEMSAEDCNRLSGELSGIFAALGESL